MSQTGKLIRKGIDERIMELKNSLKPSNFKNIPKFVRQNRILKKLEKREAIDKKNLKNEKLAILKKIRKENENKIFNSGVNTNNDKNKRAASIQVTEEAVILEIPNKFFTDVILKLVMPEMNKKIRILSSLPFLAVIIPS